MWRVMLRQDVIQGWWNEELKTWTYVQNFWILATDGKRHYMHYYQFWDDYNKAENVLRRVLLCPDFTPENKPRLWYRIYDTKEVRPPSWRKLKNWWIKY